MKIKIDFHSHEMDESFKVGLEVAIHSKLDSLSTNCQFAASLRLENNEFPNNCEDMPVPVSLGNLKKLTRAISNGSNKPDQTDRSKHLLKSKKLWTISGQELLTEHGFTALAENYSETLPELTNKMLCLMGLDPTAFKMKSTLDSVIICGTGHSHDNWSDTLKSALVEDKGPFMKMVLQIPVEGGHEGGRSKVKFGDQIRPFNVCDESDRKYHLTTFYSDCEHIYEEVKFGYRLTMQFNLELETTPLLSSLSSSADLHTALAVNEVQKALSHWTPTENNQPNMLVLLLDHRYAPSELNFGRLKGKDRLLARLLLSVGTVDMYLAQLRKSVFRPPNNETLSEEESVETVETDEENSMTERPVANCLCCVVKRCKCLRYETQTISNVDIDVDVDVVYPEIGIFVEIASLTGLDGRIVECRPILKVDVDANVIPFNHSLYTLDSLVECTDKSYLRCVFHTRPVLVISPKNSLELMLNYNFTVALDQLEANPNARALNRVITFCQDFPEKVWPEAVDREERTRRLVSMCLQLNAEYNNLKLLHLLSDNFHGHPIQYEGLRSKAIAIGVAHLIKMVGVNASDSTNDLVCERRALEQIENFAHLVMELYNVDLKDMAENIGSRCVTFLYSQSKNLMPSLSVSTLVTCAAMVFRMYEENPVRDLDTLHTFSDGLELLPLPTLFFVIEGIQTTCRSQLDNSQQCQKMQQGLHRKLLSYFLPEALAEEVMLFYLKLDDAILLKRLTQELVNQSNIDAIKMIVASADVWYQALTTTDGKWALNLLVSTRINQLEGMHLPMFSWIQSTAVFDDVPPLKRFFHSSEVSATFPGFPSQQAAETWCKKYFGPDQLDNGYSAKTEIKNEGAKIQCVVTKTRDLHRNHVELFHETRTELLELRDRRLRLLPTEECGSKVTNVITTSQQNDPVSSESTTSCVSSRPFAKRIRRNINIGNHV
ncbi:hypothetical protein DAPPUDRAFT_252924 [Daphnia pulex]|uniref:Uncharacterized protein n=1 Tax=Daphnia pulex TaxID=6669 RepID=E9H3T3_DAPPU|nr:hypothetical protein DAPPUDRAFT_252924 [Daphnia pulex]|eukprot:EFX73657.1 hypothetical protein DAPPUDRAFT_252924 [Daphnia pulex]